MVIYRSELSRSSTGIHGGLRRGAAAAALGAVLVFSAGVPASQAADGQNNSGEPAQARASKGESVIGGLLKDLHVGAASRSHDRPAPSDTTASPSPAPTSTAPAGTAPAGRPWPSDRATQPPAPTPAPTPVAPTPAAPLPAAPTSPGVTPGDVPSQATPSQAPPSQDPPRAPLRPGLQARRRHRHSQRVETVQRLTESARREPRPGLVPPERHGPHPRGRDLMSPTPPRARNPQRSRPRPMLMAPAPRQPPDSRLLPACREPGTR